MPGLTKAQRRVINEIDEIAERLRLDYRVLLKNEDPRDVTAELHLIRRQLITDAIIQKYTFFDEMLGDIIVGYYFGKTSYPQLWRTKRFQRFNHFILERLYLLQKLAHVKDIREVPKPVVTYIEKLNDLRNAVAHAFFPENLRGDRATYKGIDIFTIQGFRVFLDDGGPAVDYLLRRAYGP